MNFIKTNMINHYLLMQRIKIEKIKREKTEQNFCILSRSKKDIKICILMLKNTAYDIFNDEHKDFYSSKYICFVNTVLDQNMTPKDNDIKLVTETNNEQINLYVV